MRKLALGLAATFLSLPSASITSSVTQAAELNCSYYDSDFDDLFEYVYASAYIEVCYDSTLGVYQYSSPIFFIGSDPEISVSSPLGCYEVEEENEEFCGSSGDNYASFWVTYLVCVTGTQECSEISFSAGGDGPDVSVSVVGQPCCLLEQEE